MYTYRASELGGCVKMLVAKRLGMKPNDKPPASMVKIFDRGHRHETANVATMAEDGWVVSESQKEVTLAISDEIQVMGHLDGIVSHPLDSPIEKVLESKSPQAWRMFIEEMYEIEPSPMIQRYKWQLSCYMLAEGKEALVSCLDEQFQLRFHGVELPFYNLEDVKERVGMIEELAAEGYQGLPKFCSPREYPCQYFHLHEDEHAAFDIDSELDHAVAKYTVAKDKLDAAKERLDREKELLMSVMGTRRKVQTDKSVVTIYNRKNTTYDYKKMRLDGIDVDAYKNETQSADIPRISKKGEQDGGV